MLGFLRYLRHKKLKRYAPVFVTLGRLYRWTARTLGVKGSVKHMIGPYGPFVLNGEFAFSNFAAWGDGHNNGYTALIEMCRGRQCVLDVGAHIGLVCLPLSRVLAPRGVVFAFEPAQGNLTHLHDHLRKNGIDNVEVVEALVGADEAQSVSFYERTGSSGTNSVVHVDATGEYQAVGRPQISIDAFCARRGVKPDVIKIDVEGAELGVLEGAVETMRRHKPLVMLSVHPKHIAKFGRHVDEVRQLVAAAGYRCQELDGQPVREFRLAEYLLLPE